MPLCFFEKIYLLLNILSLVFQVFSKLGFLSEEWKTTAEKETQKLKSLFTCHNDVVAASALPQSRILKLYNSHTSKYVQLNFCIFCKICRPLTYVRFRVGRTSGQ